MNPPPPPPPQSLSKGLPWSQPAAKTGQQTQGVQEGCGSVRLHVALIFFSGAGMNHKIESGVRLPAGCSRGLVRHHQPFTLAARLARVHRGMPPDTDCKGMMCKKKLIVKAIARIMNLTILKGHGSCCVQMHLETAQSWGEIT